MPFSKFGIVFLIVTCFYLATVTSAPAENGQVDLFGKQTASIIRDIRGSEQINQAVYDHLLNLLFTPKKETRRKNKSQAMSNLSRNLVFWA